jgi:LuxR family maltose regulon positive regulatory protein
VPAPEAPPDTGLVWTKLRPPAIQNGLVRRAGLESLLRAGLRGKLCLLAAPAGSGKTTLLVQCRATAGSDRTAWVSLDAGDNDPARFWTDVIEVVRTVEPGVGAAALADLRRTSVDLYRTVLPSLLNELSTIGSQLFLMLDDYHVVSNPTCHQTFAFFLDYLPLDVHVALSTRADPPLPLARMRTRGELTEIRAADLRFTSEEASALLNGLMGLELARGDVERLAERTEGWVAGLYLAGLSLRGRPDPHAFLASFHGTHRHIADYLAAEVLDRQPEEIQTFLLRTSILERLSGPLCDAVLEVEGSAARLGGLERSNLFLVPLDDHREWYRYHHLFVELLRAELANRDAALIPVLHRRAAAWHRHNGYVDEAIRHAGAAGAYGEAGALIARHWLWCWRHGRRATVARWLDSLPEEAISADPPVAFVAAWIRGFSGASKLKVERWLAALEAAGDDAAPPEGISSLAFGAALARAAFVFDDVGQSLRAAHRALELASPGPSASWWMAQAALGQVLYLAGQPAEARLRLERLVRRVSPAAQPYAVVVGTAVLSLIAADADDDRAAASLARGAVALVEDAGLTTEPLCGIVYLAWGSTLARQGERAAAEAQLERALELFQIDSLLAQRALAVLLLASVRRDQGDLSGAQALLARTRGLLERFTDPGALPARLAQAKRALGATPRDVGFGVSLTKRELAVLHLLPSWLSNQEMAHELYVSVNTVRTHLQAIYRKLQVTTRAQAVARARQLGLLPRIDTHRLVAIPPR